MDSGLHWLKEGVLDRLDQLEEVPRDKWVTGPWVETKWRASSIDDPNPDYPWIFIYGLDGVTGRTLRNCLEVGPTMYLPMDMLLVEVHSWLE